MESHVGNSVLDHFSSLSDPRIELKSSHILVEIVAMALCGIIAGADNWVEIADFAKEKKDWFKTFLKLPAGTPSHDTFGRVFAMINPEEFGTCFISWLQRLFPSLDSDVISIDESRARKENAPENLAIMRRFALSLIKKDSTRKAGIAASRKRAGWSLDYLKHLLRLK